MVVVVVVVVVKNFQGSPLKNCYELMSDDRLEMLVIK